MHLSYMLMRQNPVGLDTGPCLTTPMLASGKIADVGQNTKVPYRESVPDSNGNDETTVTWVQHLLA